jgi:hypothetical protein
VPLVSQSQYHLIPPPHFSRYETRASPLCASAQAELTAAPRNESHKGIHYSLDMLRRGVSSTGSLTRLKLLLLRLRLGEPAVVAAVGGSNMIMCDKSWCFHHLLFEWLNTSFPHTRARSVNGGLNGMGSEYWARCLEAHMPVVIYTHYTHITYVLNTYYITLLQSNSFAAVPHRRRLISFC